MREQSRKVALCGVLCGLAVVVLLLGGLFSLAVYCAPLLAMAVLLPVLEEYGPGTAGAAYGAVAILALLLVPDREAALVYVFFGWYPHFSHIPNAPLNAGLNCSTVRWLSS